MDAEKSRLKRRAARRALEDADAGRLAQFDTVEDVAKRLLRRWLKERKAK